MLRVLTILNGKLGSNGLHRWRFLGLLVHQDQNTLQKSFLGGVGGQGGRGVPQFSCW